MAAYAYFYNPLRFLVALVRPKSKLYLADAGMQVIGMWGLSQTIRRTLGWAWRLVRGPIERKTQVPGPQLPVRTLAEGQSRVPVAPVRLQFAPDLAPRTPRPADAERASETS
jgi:hypothetical protein